MCVCVKEREKAVDNREAGLIFNQVERTNGSVTVKVYARDRFGMSAKARLGMFICSRTTMTRIRRDADEERKEQDPTL